MTAKEYYHKYISFKRNHIGLFPIDIINYLEDYHKKELNRKIIELKQINNNKGIDLILNKLIE